MSLRPARVARRPGLRPGRLVLALLLALAGPLPSPAQGANGDAVAKAKLVITFARFVQWPAGAFASPDAPLRLCVQHASPGVGDAFAAHQADVVAGRHVQLVVNAVAEGGCHLLYVDASAPHVQGAPHPATEPTLTLGSVDGFVAHGGMVEIVNVDDTLKFDVNLRAVHAAQLGISSQVLRLARSVRE